MLDKERMSIAKTLKLNICTAREWFKNAYSAEGDNLYEAIQANPGYQGIKAPRNLRHRYIFEDVPMSLMPIASIGKQYGISVRAMDSIIRLACIIHKTDYYRRGRTIEKLGIKDLSVDELTRYVNDGTLDL